MTHNSSDNDDKAKKSAVLKYAIKKSSRRYIWNSFFQGDTAKFAAHVGYLAQCADGVAIIKGLSTKFQTLSLRYCLSGSNKVDPLGFSPLVVSCRELSTQRN